MKKLMVLLFAILIYNLTFNVENCKSQWILQNVYPLGDTLTSIMFVDNLTGWTVGYSGIILKSTNGGINWYPQVSGVSYLLNSVFFIDNNTGFAVGSVGTICKTTNGGINWTSQFLGGYLFSVYFVNSNTGWTAGAFGQIQKTTNGGTNWIQQSSGTIEHFISLSFIDVNTGWITGTNGIICKTINGGVNWNVQIFDSTTTHSSVKFIDGNTGWVTGNGLIYKTTNGGINWNVQTSGTAIVSLNFVNANTGFAVGAYGSVVRTSNGGTNWNNQLSGTSNILFSVFFKDNFHGWIAGYGGTILRTTNGGSTFISKIGITRPDKFALEQNYPNPFNPSTNIRYEIPKNGFVKLVVFDALGHEVETLVNEKQSPGTYEATFNASQYPSGVYFYRLTAEGYSETKKMLFVK